MNPIDKGEFPTPKYLSLEEAINLANSVENPYPKDIFTWENKEPATQTINGKEVPLSKGRLNEFAFNIVEYFREKMIKALKNSVIL